MPYKRIIGLNVIDDEGYQKYREGMMPILESYGGSFGFDFKIAEILKSKTQNPINRVFTIDFPSKVVMNQFFSNPNYLEVKCQYFKHSVDSSTVITMHETIE